MARATGVKPKPATVGTQVEHDVSSDTRGPTYSTGNEAPAPGTDVDIVVGNAAPHPRR